jgi:uncharacterized protein YehS (DUF1456 family)
MTDREIISMTLDNYFRFLAFFREHPEVYDDLVAYLRKLKDKGFKQHSVKTCWAVLRFNIQIQNGPGEDYKLNDLYQSFYSRLIYAKEPDLRGFFELREKQMLGLHEISTVEVYRRMNQDFATGY